MRHWLLVPLLSLLFSVNFVAIALAQPKAYAPENVGRLSIPDQVRVIEREYADQSGGRLIPDDQLEFYLDQVQSGWGFSHIQEDILLSLRGGSWRSPVSGWQPRAVTCSSVDRRYTECRAPFRGRAVLTFQFSDRPCIEGQTWGQGRGGVWVDQGCRGRFAEARGGDRGPTSNPGYGAPSYSVGIVCESKQGKRRRCPTGVNGPVHLVEQYSDSPCIEGDTWAWTPGEVWVTRGCRARFEAGSFGRPSLPITGGLRPGYGGAAFSIVCESDDGRYRTCAWEGRYGRPWLAEQLSRSACIEGQSWGFGREGIWVDRGCRGRFEGR